MTPSPRLRSDERGFTLIEVMVAATLLIVGVLGVMTMLDGANRATARTKAREGGVNLAREAIEAARAVPYPELLPGQIETEIQGQPGLGDANGAAGWQVKRRGILYTVTASVCSVDDGTLPTTDGYGNHTGGFYCSDSATEGTADTNPDDYKRVTLDVTWKDGTEVRTARQEAVINNPGSAFAPAIKTLAPTSPNVTKITNPSVKLVTFTATTSSRPQEVKWFVDNVQQGDASATSTARTTWTFTWDITNVVDGTYLVGAEAYDQFGQSGTSRVVTMELNRYQPSAPAGFVGGRNPLWGTNGDFAEFEWSPNPERDVAGYRVYRQVGVIPSMLDVLVCETSVDDDDHTQCIDDAAPALTGVAAIDTVRYYVVAVAPAMTGSGLEESPPSVVDAGDPTRPGAPTVTSATQDANGTTLEWLPPADSDIRYYRLYRDDNTTWEKRVDRSNAGADIALTDPEGATACHRYWVTAVDENLAESDFAPAAGIDPCGGTP